jgi:lysophospholipase L1-like esterase
MCSGELVSSGEQRQCDATIRRSGGVDVQIDTPCFHFLLLGMHFLPRSRAFAIGFAVLGTAYLALPSHWSLAQTAAPAAPAAEKKPTGPERWEKDIAAFEKQDAAMPPIKGGIVFVGSSSIRMWRTLAEDFPKHNVLNRGFGGSQVSDSVHFADRVVTPYEPRMVVMYAGGNDLNAKKTPERVFADFRAFVDKVRAKLPDVEIAYISIAGNPARWKQVEEVKAANKMIADYCAKAPKLKYIDVFTHMLGTDGLPKPDIFLPDRLHMNAEGYKIWKEIVGKELGAPDKS